MYARTLCSALATVLLCMATCVSQAAVVINMAEQGGDVVATMSGTLNITDLSTGGTGGQPGFMNPSSGLLLLGGSTNSFAVYTTITSPPNAGAFGTGGSTLTSSFSGDFLGLISLNSSIRVPTGYTSGAALSSTTTWSSTTLATLGVTPGDYVWSWGSGANADTATLSVAAPVPEPATWMLGLGAAACGGIGTWRQRSLRKAAGA